MNVIHRRGWEIPDRLATPEHFVFNRRSFVAAGVSALTLSPLGATAQRLSDVAKLPDPSADLYPAKRNEKYVLDRAITNEKVNGNYNNFYEFGTSKSIAAAAQALPIRPWTVKIDGMVEKPMEVGIDDMIRKLTLEERTYRHRCVEAWGMTIAWTGFPFAKLVEFARPLGSAQYVRMETFTDPKVAPVSGSRGIRGIRGLMSKVSRWRKRPTNSPFLRPVPTGIRLRGNMVRHCDWPCRGNMASSPSSRSCASASLTSGRKDSGKHCSPPNMASRRTSTRKCRTRAGARRPKR
jgi:hypothetical protein